MYKACASNTTEKSLRTAGTSSRKSTSYGDVTHPHSIKCSIPLTKLHLQTEQETVFACTLCNKMFTDNSELVKHISESHAPAQRKRRYMCPKCDADFATKVSLTWHLDYCKTDNELPVMSFRNTRDCIAYRCTLCDKTCRKLPRLHEHIRVYHCTDEYYACSVCKKAFSSSVNLKMHMNVHKPAPCTFVCDICQAEFKWKTELQIHTTIKHSISRKDGSASSIMKDDHQMPTTHDTQEHTCGHCPMVFKCKETLDKHKEKVHFNITFQCYMCSQSFATLLILQHHISVVHKKHECQDCRLAFHKRSKLYKHMAHFHSSVSIKCNICTESFLGADVLKQHISMVHKCKCEHCGRQFDKRSKLLKHKQRIHHVKV